jgi:hypothetical protein
MAYRHNSSKKTFIRSRATLDFYPLPQAYYTGLPTDSYNLVGYSDAADDAALKALEAEGSSDKVASGKFDWNALVGKAGDAIGVLGGKALEARQARKSQQDLLKAQTEQAKWAALSEAAKVKGTGGGSSGASTMNIVLIGILGAAVLFGGVLLFKSKPSEGEE